jgi:dTDP-4-dehydrorhamnose reductase
VFSGDGAPRSESARPDPVWDYGRWKAEAEEVVSGRDPNAVIVRLPLVISVDPADHIVEDILTGHENGTPTVWFSDEVRQPAYAEELSRAIWDIASVPLEERTGVWHLPGPERLSRYEIAERTVAAIGLDRSSIASAVTPPEAHRPRDLNLTGERARARIGWSPTRVHTPTSTSGR